MAFLIVPAPMSLTSPAAVEDIQDATGASVTDSSNIDFTYNDGANQITADLTNTTVTPGSYGSGSSIPSFTVDAKGRITAASGNALSAANQTLSNLTSPTAVNQHLNIADKNIVMTNSGSAGGSIYIAGSTSTGLTAQLGPNPIVGNQSRLDIYSGAGQSFVQLALTTGYDSSTGSIVCQNNPYGSGWGGVAIGSGFDSYLLHVTSSGANRQITIHNGGSYSALCFNTDNTANSVIGLDRLGNNRRPSEVHVGTLLKIGASTTNGSLQMASTSGANITWTTDGGGNIGAAGANRPNQAFIGTGDQGETVRVGKEPFSSTASKTGISMYTGASSAQIYFTGPGASSAVGIHHETSNELAIRNAGGIFTRFNPNGLFQDAGDIRVSANLHVGSQAALGTSELAKFTSTSKGVVFPNITSAPSTPTNGMVVYDTNDSLGNGVHKLNVYANGAWVALH